MKSRIAIVILNWNGKEHLRTFLPSVVQYSKDAEIIVADNASTDDSVDFLRKNYPEIRIVQNRENSGFAKGYNDALHHVDAAFYLLLNSDIEVTENWLSPLVACMEDQTVAACQPKVRSYLEKSRFEHSGACGGYVDYNYFPFCRGRIFQAVEEDHGQYDGPAEVFWASGAALLIRASVFHEMNGFDEDFFAHMEEIDLCWRIKRTGLKIMVVPSSEVYHLGGGTLPYNSPQKTFLNFRNSLFMITKNHEGPLFPKLLWRLCIDGIAAITFVLKGEFRQFQAVFKAHMVFYSNVGRFLKKRREQTSGSNTFNPAGRFRGNILWNFHIKGVKQYSSLNQRLFQ